MQTIFVILIILASVLLSFFVLIQNPKGGGLVSGFAGGTNIMGVKRTGDFLEKMTWGLIISIIVISLAINVMPASSGPVSGGRAADIEAGSSSILPTMPSEAAPAPVVEASPADSAQ